MRSWGPKATGGKHLGWAFAGLTFNLDPPASVDASALTTWAQFLREHQEGAVHGMSRDGTTGSGWPQAGPCGPLGPDR